MSPAIQAILAATITEEVDTGIEWLRWNKYTAAGWIAAGLGFINFILMLPCVFQVRQIIFILILSSVF